MYLEAAFAGAEYPVERDVVARLAVGGSFVRPDEWPIECEE